MQQRDWLISGDGRCVSCPPPKQWDLLTECEEYRLYHFLADVDRILDVAEEEDQTEDIFLQPLRRLVRKLLLKTYWVTTKIPEPQTGKETAIALLYEEPGYPLTLQMETMLPGVSTPIHNHGTWGILAVVKGRAKNITWTRSPSAEFPDKIEKVGEEILEVGEIVSLTTEAIHALEAAGDESCVTLNLYGETNFSGRFQFDPATHAAKPLETIETVLKHL